MFLPDANDLTPMEEKYKKSDGFLYGTDERSLFTIVSDYAAKSTISTYLLERGRQYWNKLFDIKQAELTPEQAREDYGVKIDRPETLDKVQYLAQIEAVDNYIARQVSIKKDSENYFWPTYISAVLAGSLLDPVLLFSGAVTAGAAAKAVHSSSRVAKLIYNTNPLISGTSRAVLFGAPEAGLSIAQGFSYAKQTNQNYDNTDAVLDGFLGLAVGTAFSFLHLKGVNSPESKGFSKNFRDEMDIIEKPKALPAPEEFKQITYETPDDVFMAMVERYQEGAVDQATTDSAALDAAMVMLMDPNIYNMDILNIMRDVYADRIWKNYVLRGFVNEGDVKELLSIESLKSMFIDSIDRAATKVKAIEPFKDLSNNIFTDDLIFLNQTDLTGVRFVGTGKGK